MSFNLPHSYVIGTPVPLNTLHKVIDINQFASNTFSEPYHAYYVYALYLSRSNNLVKPI